MKKEIILLIVIGFTIWLRGYITPPPIDYSKIPAEYHGMVQMAEGTRY